MEADAGSAPQILAVIRELELPLALLFNRSRLMVLPQAISKSTGLRKALNAFRLSTVVWRRCLAWWYWEGRARHRTFLTWLAHSSISI